MQEMEYFYLLKHQLLEKYREIYPHWNKSLHDFKGREIANLQLQLQKEINGRISEKWFYLHLKPKENVKLPRIDMLDMLSQFVGCENWDHFIQQKTPTTLPTTKELPLDSSKTKKLSPLRYFILLALLGSLAFIIWTQQNKGTVYNLCFVNADTKLPITERDISIKILPTAASPFHHQASTNGCFELETKEEMLQLVVSANYYHTDTIYRKFDSKTLTESIPLRRDDYALMIHLFSTTKIKDWNKQRQSLATIIADEAIIFQVAKDNNIGMEMYNKEEFIDKMSLPLNSLKNIKILHTDYQDGKIIGLRFMQMEQ